MASLVTVVLVIVAAAIVQGKSLGDVDAPWNVDKLGKEAANVIHIIRPRDVGSDTISPEQAAPVDTGKPYSYGHSVATFYSSSNQGGKAKETSGGIEYTNDNGKITRHVW